MAAEENNLVRRIAFWGIPLAFGVMGLKLVAWWVTGSVALLSDGLESTVNVIAAFIAYFVIRYAHKPADDDHPYGHHKAEYFSSGFEGILIMGVSAGILWAAGHRLFDPQPIEQVGWGLGLSVLSSALNGLLAWVMFRSAREHRSIALEADARHLVTDVWTSAGVLVGIAGAALTGWLWLDAVAAIAVALNILKEGVELVWRSSQGLMDSAVEPEVQSTIDATLQQFVAAQAPGAVRFDHVSTRRAGQRQFVDMHLHMPADWTLRHAAELRGQVERALMTAVPGLRATIELLPTDVEAHFDDPRDDVKDAVK